MRVAILLAAVVVVLAGASAASAAVTIATHAGTDGTVGINDTATIAGLVAPGTGTITFTAYGPSNPTCTNPPAFMSTPVAVNGNGTYTSPTFTYTAVGTYLWRAAYSGDGTNPPVTTACGAANESVSAQGFFGTSLSDQPLFPATVTVGDTDNVALVITNNSSAQLGAVTIPSGSLTLTPSCGTVPFGAQDCPVASADPGVYQPSAQATGSGDCAGQTFNVVAVPGSAVGQYMLTGPAIVLTATTQNPNMAPGISNPGSGGTCTISLTVTVLKTPTKDASPGPGLQTATVTGVNGTTASGPPNGGGPLTAAGAGTTIETVNAATPTISTTASAPVPLGGSISDSATLSGGVNPTGSITFTAFANSACTGAPAFTSAAVTVNGNGSYASGPFTPGAAGSYFFIATYSGDANNAPVATSCGDPGEVTTVDSITTVATGGTVGGTISDVATLTGGAGALSPTGTIVFRAFATAGCGGAAAFTSAPVTVNGNGSYPSGPLGPVGATGQYFFTATYTGDANNAPITTPCGAPGETATVTPVTPAIVTTATGAAVGGNISDSAVLSGGFNPTGTITFTAFTTAGCTGVPAFTSAAIPVTGTGTYASGPLGPVNVAASYQFVATYSGDTNNNPVTTTCGALGETATVTPATPAIVTTATGAALGGNISDSAVLSGGFNATGTITFRAFTSSACTGAAAFTSAPVPVNGNGTYASGPLGPVNTAGSYFFQASYSGDPNNNAVTTTCGVAGETATVAPVTPAIVTTATGAVVGGNISDSAVLSGGFNATGTITFRAFTSSACTGAAAFTAAPVPVNGNGTYASGPLGPVNTAGNYFFQASYSGDTNNSAVTTTCGVAGETATVAPVTPAIVTTASAPVTVGGNISDSAVLSGGFNPTGTITFTAFTTANCSGPAAFTSAPVTVTGNGTYASGPLGPVNAPGTYNFIASYSGDTNNTALTTACGAPGESTTVNRVTPAIVTTATGAPVGGNISDSAVLSGGASPTGTITFTAFTTAGCTGMPAFTSAGIPVAGNGTYTSGPLGPVNAAGSYQFVASYSGDANNAPLTTTCGAPGETATVAPATPAIVTTATGGVVSGNISDSAVLSGAFNATGSITFRAFTSAACTGAAAFTSAPVTVNGNGTYASGPLGPVNTAGSYFFQASYSGDANNSPLTTTCGVAGETATVAPATPAIVTTATGGVVGGNISDSAVLSGGVNPGGTITFRAFTSSSCTGAAAFTSAPVTVSGNGTYASGPLGPVNTAGSYFFQASYSGDVNNSPLTTACGASGETATVAPATPAIVTTATGGVVGGNISDSAVLSGGFNPTGTITFTVFANGACTGGAVFTSAPVTVTGNGTYASGPLGPVTAAGTYFFVAHYSGDPNNVALTTACGAPGETATVTRVTPAIVTTATGGAVGGNISDSAVLSGGTSPTGTITFTAFTNGACTGAPAFTSAGVPVNGNGTYTSGPLGPVTAAGSYFLVASYSGDANNAPLTTACGVPGETATVTPAAPTIATTASPPVVVGGDISDSAVLSGGFNPTGTITFTVFGPNDNNCSGAPAFPARNVTVNGNGTYPSGAFTSTAPGTYRFVVSYGGDANNAAVTSPCNAANEATVVNQGAPSITTVASGPATVGGSISDTATLAGGVSPTGTITFTAFGPANPNCTGAPAFTLMVPVNHGNGSYASGASPPVTAAGTYNFVAAYSGDANNAAVTSACGAPNESVTVGTQSPTVVTTASGAVPLGGNISDTAVLSGGFSPTGTITFTVFGPNDTNCSGAPAFPVSTVTVSGNGSYLSGSFTPTAAGTYKFVVHYSGDANNAAATSSCGAPNEAVAVAPLSPTISTTASPGVALGGTISDSAVLAGGSNPTGTITFTAYGPNDTNCNGAPAFPPTTVTVTGDGTYPSGSFKPTAAGTYSFVVTYGGDANNAAATSACGAPNESVVVGKASPTISTVASAPIALGGTISDSATLAGGSNPSGTITFTVYGPNDSNCNGAPAFPAATVTAAGDGSYPSPSFKPTAPGTYNFVVSYGGDANNAAATSACGAPNESVVVSKANPTISTVASTPVALGGTIHDTAFLAGGSSPTGTITFTAYGPNDTSCNGAVAFGPSTVTVNGAGSYVSPSYTPTVAGDYSFVVTYSGDANNAAATSACGAPGESVTVSKAAPTISTNASVSGSTISDTATLAGLPAGAAAPTGTVRFDVYGPGDATCAGPVVFTSTNGVNAAGTTATSDAFTITAAGTYRFVASYSGDSNYPAVASVCNAANESVAIPTPVIAVVKSVTPASKVEPGGTFTFTVQVTNPSSVDPITITSLVDNIYGDLFNLAGSTCGALKGVTLAPGASSAPCSFPGTFTGKAGDKQTDTVTVQGVDSHGFPATATAMATVTLTPVGPQIALVKSAAPATLPAPGGTFTFTAVVSNPSTLEPVTITSLVDNIYGDLATRAGSTCGALIGTVLQPGAKSAPCSFPGTFSGSAGQSQTDTITVTGTNNGTTVTATAQATVSLTPAALIAPATVTKPGKAVLAPVTIHGPAACVTKPFKTFVTGSSIASVIYYLDGRRIGEVRKRDSAGHFSITIKPAPLSKGKAHHLTAVVTPVLHSGQPVRTVRRSFAVCAPAALPRFTG